MNIGIIGLPQTGKKTLFRLLTGRTDHDHADLHVGTADIIDPRFDALVEAYRPRKQVRAKIDFFLFPKLEKESIAKGDIFKDIVTTDAICHVVRAFHDPSVYHAYSSVDPERDITTINSELLFHDLLFVEKRLERIAAQLKKAKDERQQKEQELLLKMKSHLEAERPLRLLPLSAEEAALVRSYPFITLKQMIIIINTDDTSLRNDALIKQLAPLCASEKMEMMQVSAKVEAEIAALESPEERKEFLQEIGIAEPALGQLTRLCLKALGLISFFTVGDDEVRQWLLRQGSHAPDAAGVIHSDLQRGFIRAEVMKYEELRTYKSEAALKAAGKVYLKGKDYIVEDGDILNIRFKV
ncbi:MAG: YchF family ATPase [Desulfobacterota bacterium]|nr:YchF family ATPase [Thermodesulfobacteriota bacterium]